MALDTSIALGARLPQIESPLNQMANFASMRQAQQTNALNELKMQETQRGMAENEAVRNFFAANDPSSPDFARGLYGISPERGAAFEKSRVEQAKDRALTGKTTAETEETKFKTVEKRLNILGQGFGAVRNNPTPETALRVLKYVRDNGAITDEQFQAYVADITANPDPARIKQMADEGFTATLSATEQLPSFQMQSLGGKSRVLSINPMTSAATVAPGSEGVMTATPGELLTADSQRRTQDISLRGQNLTDAREKERIAMSRVPTGYRMSAEGMLEPMPGGPTSAPISPKERQSREAKFPQATLALKSFDAKSDELLTDLAKLRDHPGLNSITGIIYGRTPSLTGAGREAQALYDKITASLQFKELQDMRNSSPTGGALGNISNQEGLFLRQAAAALDQRQEPGSVQAELDRIANSVTGTKNRLREAYEMTYDYKDVVPKKGDGVDTSNPLLR